MRVICFFLLLLCAAACRPQPAGLQTGDLLFIGIPGDYIPEEGSMDEAITAATGGGELNLIHVSIVEVDAAGEPWVIDATFKHNVDRYPLDTLISDFTLKDGSLPTYILKRLRDTTGVTQFVENAKSYIGEPYDIAFLQDNGAHYCSELVRDAYRRADGSYLFEEKPMNFRNSEGEMPPYWEILFASIGMEVPQGVPGTNPQEMSQSPVLETVAFR